MVKVGITGCDNLRAAELVRILINHPDVDLMWVKGAGIGGTRLDHIVPGIIGECELTLNPACKQEDVDVVFACDKREHLTATLHSLDLTDATHIIDLSGSHNLDHGVEHPWKYGLPEMQRRVLVHEAQLATVPGNAAMVSLLALMPMSRNLLINNPVSLHVGMGARAFPVEGKSIDGFGINSWADVQRQEVEMALKKSQSGFNQPVTLSITPIAERRTVAVTAQFKCNVEDEMIRELYDQYYDDHNFVFMVDRPIVTADVENTNKCLIRLEKDEGTGILTVHAMMDLLLKGSAGNAVHVMNLMFGLHERVGLALKATGC